MVTKNDFMAQSIDEDDVSLLINALCDIHNIATGCGDIEEIEEIAENALAPFRIRPTGGCRT